MELQGEDFADFTVNSWEVCLIPLIKSEVKT